MSRTAWLNDRRPLYRSCLRVFSSSLLTRTLGFDRRGNIAETPVRPVIAFDYLSIEHRS